jgi:hypothetical protein
MENKFGCEVCPGDLWFGQGAGLYFCSLSEGVPWTQFGMFRRRFGNFEAVRRLNMTDRERGGVTMNSSKLRGDVNLKSIIY